MELDFGYESECLVTPDTSVIWALMSEEWRVWQGRRKRPSREKVIYDDKHKNGPPNSSRPMQRAQIYIALYNQSQAPGSEFTRDSQSSSPETSLYGLAAKFAWGLQVRGLRASAQASLAGKTGRTLPCCPPRIPKISPLSLVCWLGLPYSFPSSDSQERDASLSALSGRLPRYF